MGRSIFHLTWAGAVVVVLLLNVLLPLPGQEVSRSWALGLAALPASGALILAKRPGNRVGRVLAAGGVAAGLIFLATWLAIRFPSPWSAYPEAFAAGAVVVTFWSVLSLLYLFPSGHPPTPASRRIHQGLTVALGIMAVLGVIRPDPLDITGRPNPLGLDVPALSAAFDYGFFSLVVGVLLGVWTLVVRYRHAEPTEKAQLRWFLAGSAVVAGLILLIATEPEPFSGSLLLNALEFVLAVLLFWALPAAIVVAVLRYRLYEIDRLVSRTVTYASLVAMLAAVYTSGVFLLSTVLPQAGDLTVALSTLGAAALFNPLRRRVQAAVDRRFNRPRYDALREVERYAMRLRVEVDLDQVLAGMIEVVSTTVHPATLSVWLADGDMTAAAAYAGRD